MGVGIFMIAIVFFLFAIILSQGKGASLLAGYNTMSDDEKAQYDEIALCKFMGKMMYGISFSILLLALSEVFENQILLVTGIILLIIFIVFLFVFTNTKDRFKRKSF